MVPRTYWVKIQGVPDEKKLIQLKRGVMLEDGKARVVSSHILRQKEKNSWIEVTVSEGRNHLVKRLFATIGHPVLKLKRVGFGPIRLGTLPIGQYRLLTDEEIIKIKKFRVGAIHESPLRRSE